MTGESPARTLIGHRGYFHFEIYLLQIAYRYAGCIWQIFAFERRFENKHHFRLLAVFY